MKITFDTHIKGILVIQVKTSVSQVCWWHQHAMSQSSLYDGKLKKDETLEFVSSTYVCIDNPISPHFLLSFQPVIQSGRFRAATDEGIRSGRRIDCQGQNRDSYTWNIQWVINIGTHGVEYTLFTHFISHLNCLVNSFLHFDYARKSSYEVNSWNFNVWQFCMAQHWQC